MPFDLNPAEKPVLQRQLDAEQWRWSQQLQAQTDAAFEDDDRTTFRMNGLYEQIPGAQAAPLRLPRAS